MFVNFNDYSSQCRIRAFQQALLKENLATINARKF